MKLSDGAEQFFYCRADLYEKLLIALQSYGALAARVRASKPGQLVDIATPVQMTRATRTGQDANGHVILEFGTDLGFPMQVAMTRDQTQKTIELLQTELGRTPPQAPRSSTN
ncbi:MAG TPA: hypothetical protein VII56_03210 [Rhizomicrobium sp.]